MTESSKKLASFEYAKKVMFKNIKKIKTEIIDIYNAGDRVLAENIYTKIDIPNFDNSAVDGFGFKNSKKKKNTK